MIEDKSDVMMRGSSGDRSPWIGGLSIVNFWISRRLSCVRFEENGIAVIEL